MGLKPISIKNLFHGSCINIKLNFWDRQLNMRVSEVISASKFSIGHKVDSEVSYAVACFRTKDTFHLSWIWPKRVANNRSTLRIYQIKRIIICLANVLFRGGFQRWSGTLYIACALILKAFDINLPLRSHGVQKTIGRLLKYFVTVWTGGIQFNAASSGVAFLKVLGNPEQWTRLHSTSRMPPVNTVWLGHGYDAVSSSICNIFATIYFCSNLFAMYLHQMLQHSFCKIFQPSICFILFATDFNNLFETYL